MSLILLVLKLILIISNLNTFQFAKCIPVNSSLDVDDYPYLVHIAHFKLGLWCSGTTVTPKWILTSATCLTDTNPRTFQSYYANIRDFTVIPASTLKNSYPDFICPTKFIVNKKYDFTTFENDLALIKLEDEITVKEARAINLSYETDYKNSLQEKGKLVNFKRELKPDDQHITKNNLTERLVKAINENQVTVIDYEVCKEKITAVIDKLNVSGVYSQNDTKTCTGNESGPLLVDDMQIGILSYGIRCNPSAEGVIHSRIVKNQDFPVEWDFRTSSANVFRSNLKIFLCLFVFYYFLVL